MAMIDFTPLYRNSIGFDRFLDILDTAMNADHTKAGYPPYNIEELEENQYAISLAVAGFDAKELDIQVKNNLLTIRGTKSQSKEKHHYLYQGIAERDFERSFNLADYVEVASANLDNGLLTIHLIKNIPETIKPKSIEINTGQVEIAGVKNQKESKAVEAKDKAA